MKTVFVVGARGIPDVEGGAEKNAERLFPRIAARGWRIILAGLDSKIKSSHYRGAELWAAPTVRVLGTDKLLYYIMAFFYAVRIRPDIVHLQGLGAALFLWAYKLLGCKIIVRYGSADYLLTKWGAIGRAGFRLAEYQLRFADAVVAVTPALAARLRSKGTEQNVHIIANALDDPEDFCSKKTEGISLLIEGPYMLAVGRVTHQKKLYPVDRSIPKIRKISPGPETGDRGRT